MKFKESHIYRFLAEITGIIKSTEKMRTVVRIPLYNNAIFLIIANVLSAIIAFVFWIIAARFYSTEDVGLASAAISAVSLLAMLANFGLGYGLIRFLPHSGKSAKNMINSCFTIGSLASVMAAFIFLCGLGFWSPALIFIRHNPIYFAAFVLFTIALTLSSLTDQAFIAERRAGFVLAKNIIFNLLRVILVIVLAAFFQTFGIFASWGMAIGVSLLLGVFVFLPRAQLDYRPFFAVSRTAVNDMLRFSFGNYIGSLFWTAPTYILPIIVVNLLGAEPNAYFYIAWTMGNMLAIIPIAVSTSLFAEGSYDEERLGLNIRRSLKMIALILVPAVILILAIAPQLLLLFGGSYSENATTLLRLLTISTLPQSINVVYLDIKRVEKKLKIIVGLTTLIAVITIGLSYWLMPRMGFNGTGIAWLTGQGVIALLIIASSLKKRRPLR